jgi:hypothetical protein
MRTLILVSALLAVLACNPPANPTGHDPRALVPASSEVAGWTRTGNLDTAATEAELTGLIGAPAHIYAANGFNLFCSQSFSGTIAGSPAGIGLYVADLPDSAHARSLYAAMASAGQTAWTGDNPGREARVLFDSTACAIDFWARTYYVWLIVDTSCAASLEAARYFSRVVGHKADSTTPIPPRPKDCVDVVPTSNEISGWNRTGNMAVCENQTQLFDLIDGEAQTYVDNGFVKSAFQDYSGEVSGNQVTLRLRVFDMGDTLNARSVYTAAATGGETPWTGDNPGAEARIDESLLFDYRIDLRESKFYVSIDIADKSDPGLSIAKLFAYNIAGAIQDTTD